MKSFLFILTFLLVTGRVQAQAPGAVWTEADRASLLHHLDASKEALAQAVRGLTQQQLHFKPNSVSWNIAEVVEHLAVYEEVYHWEYLFTLRQPPQAHYLDSTRGSDSVFLALQDMPGKHEALAFALPRGKYGDFENTWKGFLRTRAALTTAVSRNGENLRVYFSLRPSKGLFGYRWRDAHQVVLVNAAHVYRHLKQIERIKAHPAYPKPLHAALSRYGILPLNGLATYRAPGQVIAKWSWIRFSAYFTPAETFKRNQ
ncbi:MAG TPA: DinB family protein [Chitinophagaceae bacterium]